MSSTLGAVVDMDPCAKALGRKSCHQDHREACQLGICPADIEQLDAAHR
jgi:hypothetical protein